MSSQKTSSLSEISEKGESRENPTVENKTSNDPQSLPIDFESIGSDSLSQNDSKERFIDPYQIDWL